MPTKIEWAEEVWNPITGCTPISEGCKNCYARRYAQRLKGLFGYPKDDPFKVTFHPDRLNQPLKWRKPRRIFVCSMGDLFHNDIKFMEINRIIGKALSAHRKNSKHTWIFLTKRPENIIKWRNWAKTVDISIAPYAAQHAVWFQNIAWLGVTAENQKRADERIPILLEIPAAVRFVSVEPMLAPVELRPSWFENSPPQFSQREFFKGGIDWVIAGSESGYGRRYCDEAWVRKLKDQCVVADIPFFFKQMAYNMIGPGVIKMPILDGQVWNQFPTTDIGGDNGRIPLRKSEP